MKLIDEIEAAAKRCTLTTRDGNDLLAYGLITSPWWDRIKPALLYGEAMAAHLSTDPWKEDDDDVQDMVARFRAATEGTDAAAIGRAS